MKGREEGRCMIKRQRKSGRKKWRERRKEGENRKKYLKKICMEKKSP